MIYQRKGGEYDGKQAEQTHANETFLDAGKATRGKEEEIGLTKYVHCLAK